MADRYRTISVKFYRCQQMASVPNSVEKIVVNVNRLSKAHERYRQTDDRRTDYDIANVNVSSRSLKTILSRS